MIFKKFLKKFLKKHIFFKKVLKNPIFRHFRLKRDLQIIYSSSGNNVRLLKQVKYGTMAAEGE